MLDYENKIAALEEEKAKLRKELDNLKLFYSELESTNQHLISATWRERDIKKQLKETLEELNNTKLVVETQNKRISESINYAQRIQSAINASENDLVAVYPNSFIFYKPKDVISGDFQFVYKTEKYLYMAAVDCTGHGVPGAMLSIIGNLILTDIINNHPDHTPSQVLLDMHHTVVKTLKQDLPGNESFDGMDIALCRINLKTNELVYSGAHRPLMLISNGVVSQIAGDKCPIGGIQYRGKNNFTDFFTQCNKNDCIFIFSDGLPDQIGGPEGKKFMTKQIKDLIETSPNLNMNQYKTMFEDNFNSWKSNNKQVDDVIMLGLKFD